MRVALVHDYLTQFGGAERVLEALMELFPHAPVYTLLYNATSIPQIDGRRVRTSWLQRLPGAKRHHRYFPLLMPLAVEQFDLSGFDIVLSASHSFGKGVIVGPNTLHISYCFTPVRYAWDDSHRYVREFSRSRFFRRFAPVGLTSIRLWDYMAAQRPHVYLTLSYYVARRIRKYYGREAAIIYPPVSVDQFEVSQSDQGYYVVVSRLVPYKRIDIAIQACERLGRRLKVVGVGPEREELARLAGPQTEFLGFVPDQDLPRLYAGAKALLFPQEEDFGITPLEAAASGKPTIAFGSGGALETIVPNVTGLFFTEQTAAGLAEAIQKSERMAWNPAVIRQQAERFSREVFLRSMREAVHNEWLRFRNQKLETRN